MLVLHYFYTNITSLLRTNVLRCHFFRDPVCSQLHTVPKIIWIAALKRPRLSGLERMQRYTCSMSGFCTHTHTIQYNISSVSTVRQAWFLHRFSAKYLGQCAYLVHPLLLADLKNNKIGYYWLFSQPALALFLWGWPTQTFTLLSCVTVFFLLVFVLTAQPLF